jgi:hypothetical protein
MNVAPAFLVKRIDDLPGIHMRLYRATNGLRETKVTQTEFRRIARRID